MIVTVTLTPALDKTVVIPGFAVDKVNRVQSMRLDAGGKGINVSKSLLALGMQSVATGILGGGSGQFIEDSLTDMGVESAFVHVAEATRTNLKVNDPDGQTHTDINEAGSPVAPEVMEELLQKVVGLVGPGDIVVLAGKAPPKTPDTIFADWCRALAARNVQVYLDADGDLLREGVKACPALIKPNEEELARLMGRPLPTIDDLKAAGRELLAQGVGTVVISMGGDGALFLQGDKALRCPALHVDVLSTVGAGDSMMAAMCYGTASGMAFADICRLSIAVSAATVSCPGTQAAPRELVEQLLPQVKLETLD